MNDDHLATGCPKFAISYSAEEIIDVIDVVPIGFCYGSHGSVSPEYTENAFSFSNYPLSAGITCSKVCSAFLWGLGSAITLNIKYKLLKVKTNGSKGNAIER